MNNKYMLLYFKSQMNWSEFGFFHLMSFKLGLTVREVITEHAKTAQIFLLLDPIKTWVPD